jgi:hypothetical protein
MSERHNTATGREIAPLRVEAERGRRRGPGQTATRPRQANQLEICPCCRRDLVYPIDWSPAGPAHWDVSLRCPECEWSGRGVFAQEIVDRFDDVLDDGTQALLDDLELLTRANMEEQIEIFATALERDLIVPEDF